MGFRPTDEELKDLLDEVMDISLIEIIMVVTGGRGRIW